MSLRKLAMLAVLLALLGAPGCGGPPRSDLEKAIGQGKTEEVARALDGGADVNQAFADGRTPLLLAVVRHQPEVVALLLERGADMEVRDDRGRTLFEILWERGHPSHRDCLSLARLLAAGYPVDKAPGEDGRTWLHNLAGGCDEAAVVEALVAQGFEVDARDENGWTPLHVAVEKSRYGSALALLDAGADVNAETTEQVGSSYTKGETLLWRYRYEAGSRPLDLEHQAFSRATRDKDLKKLLEERGGKNNPAVENTLP